MRWLINLQLRLKSLHYFIYFDLFADHTLPVTIIVFIMHQVLKTLQREQLQLNNITCRKCGSIKVVKHEIQAQLSTLMSKFNASTIVFISASNFWCHVFLDEIIFFSVSNINCNSLSQTTQLVLYVTQITHN